MATNKLQILTIKASQIEKNPILALGVGEEDITAYGRLSRAFGNVAPVIVGPTPEQGYRVLFGQAQLEAAMVQSKTAQTPVIVANTSEESQQMKLALMMAALRQEGSSLSEGAFIDALIRDHGVTRQELAKMLKKSKSWISKRQALAVRLTKEVKELVKSGSLCARSAEEIAKLPADTQMDFAKSIIRNSLNKTNVACLVSMYTHPDTSPAAQTAIVQDPQTVLDAHIVTSRIPRRSEKRSPAQKMSASMRFLIQLLHELKGRLIVTDSNILGEITSTIKLLQDVTADLNVVLEIALQRVSPGKPAGGEKHDQH